MAPEASANTAREKSPPSMTPANPAPQRAKRSAGCSPNRTSTVTGPAANGSPHKYASTVDRASPCELKATALAMKSPSRSAAAKSRTRMRMLESRRRLSEGLPDRPITGHQPMTMSATSRPIPAIRAQDVTSRRWRWNTRSVSATSSVTVSPRRTSTCPRRSSRDLGSTAAAAARPRCNVSARLNTRSGPMFASRKSPTGLIQRRATAGRSRSLAFNACPRPVRTSTAAPSSSSPAILSPPEAIFLIVTPLEPRRSIARRSSTM